MKKRFNILVVLMILCFAVIALSPMMESRAVSYQAQYAGVVSTQNTALNIRQNASISSARVGVLYKGSYVSLIERQGDWWFVEYDKGKYGYCSAQYITKKENTYVGLVNTARTALNVRSGAGTEFRAIAALPKGSSMIVLSSKGAWLHVLYDGYKTGYVSQTYVSKPQVSNPSTTKPYDKETFPVSLIVPSYRQGDSRWGSVKIGTKGGTIRTIGCLVTSLAMSESQRTGTTIYPNQQAAKMSFTAGGAAYWPSNYERAFLSGKQANLQRIYEVLQTGRPVLVGGKTSSGGQHWVVVTGYTGSGTGSFSASDFTINDPASAQRQTLDAHWKAYPIIYYIAYYK